ncbi:SDR family NAD(P)-dependent oxidoreductase [Nonomuraea sp. K274]|uniref:SDR family NAD(P)-dependent oxidoreductase n=1 Tax=Nonomuraea cypriaca TaxID=1187855 RepID=A0A931F367_9ACTN|nr:SDR family NAD(P)-dependent oxidoreductase [Nonomuraea cypriaca]MBF8189831.1 SDR family NAD(P)-dependent oxidoreductase [Nonomuraea cypriaca]
MNGFSLRGRTALVTGSGRGLGLEMARGLAGAGARVVLNGRDKDHLAGLAARMDVEYAAFDVTDLDAAARALEEVAARGRAVDVLVNNVGQRDRRGMADFTAGELARLLDVDLVSAFGLSRLVAGDLVRRGAPGRIINVSSVIGVPGTAGDVSRSTAA